MTATDNVTLNAISPAQSRAARGLLNWSRDDLSERCGVAKRTLLRFETGEGDTRSATLAAVRSALEAAGVVFIEQNGDGPGVRLRKVAT